jgi:hypothetical protein
MTEEDRRVRRRVVIRERKEMEMTGRMMIWKVVGMGQEVKEVREGTRKSQRRRRDRVKFSPVRPPFLPVSLFCSRS